MGYTCRQYPVVELGLSVIGHPNGVQDCERKQEGDIIEVRRPAVAIGFKEMARFLWLRVTGLEDAVIGQLCQGIDGYEKRRYRIPLERLAQVAPGFDVAAARNPTLIYQPFLVVDEDTGLYVTATAPLEAQGLVLDLVTGEYL